MKNRLLAGILACSMVALSGPAARGADPAPAPVPAAPSTPPPSTPPSSSNPVDPAEVAADVLVVRPVGFAATVVGAAIFVVALPFAAIAGDIDGASRSLVGAPAKFTFKRKLGEF